MKRVVISAVVIVLMCSFAMAASCSNDQTIMKLYSSTNTHGAIWNYSGYETRICYSRFFTMNYSGSNAHDCDSDSIVLSLSAFGNAHAASADSSSYLIDACHKGLENCEIKPVGTSCDSGDAEIVYLSSTENAHLSTQKPVVNSSGSVKSGYRYKICCGCSPSGCEKLPSSISEAGFCSELDEASCNTDDGGIASQDVSCKASDKSLCRCAWNTQKGKCEIEWGNITLAGMPSYCNYRCVVESNDRTECDGVSKVVSYSAMLVSTTSLAGCSIPAGTQDESCKSGSAILPCGGTETQLPFFGIWQVGACLVSIALIYALFGRK